MKLSIQLLIFYQMPIIFFVPKKKEILEYKYEKKDKLLIDFHQIVYSDRIIGHV